MNDSTRSPIPGRGRKSSGRRRAIIFGIVVLLAGGGWYGWHIYQARQNAKVDYIFGTVDRGNIEDLVASSGSLQPRDFVDVGAQVSGQIEKIYVEVGDVVKAGDKLVDIDAATSQAKVDANEASIKSARASIKSRENQLEKNKRDAERQKRLFAEGATTNENMINAQTQLEDAASSLEIAKLQLEQQEANARIEANNLKYTRIVAPIGGTVMSIEANAKVGSTLNATNSVPKILRIASLDLMTTKAEVSEADVSRLEKQDNPVYFTTLGGGTRRWSSTLKRIEPTPNVTNSVVTYNALFDIGNEDRFLMPSMTAQIYFIAAEARDVVRVPLAALQQGAQIARELAAKERLEKKTPAAATPGAAPGAPGARPGAANTAASAAAAGGSTPATPAAQGGAAGNAPANRQANAQGNRPNGQGGPGGGFNPQDMQNMTPEQREDLQRRMRDRGAGGAAPGGGNPGANGGERNGGQRAGGANGGFGGGGRNMQNMTAEERDEMMRSFRGQRGGGAGGAGGAGGGNFNRQGMAGNADGGTRTTRTARRTQGTVMVKTADGKLESRRVVIGVTDRVLGEVLEGLKEGDEVVIGRREKEAAAAAPSQQRNNNNNNNNFNQGNRGGNFQGGGGNFQGGGGGFPGGGGRGF